MADLTLTPGRAPRDDGRGRDGRDGDGHHGVGHPGASASTQVAIDPRAVRVRLGPASQSGSDEPVVLGPLAVPLAPRSDPLAGRGILGGQVPTTGSEPTVPVEPEETIVRDASPAPGPTVLVDGEPVALRLVRRGPGRAALVLGQGSEARRARVVFSGAPATGDDGIVRREVVVDGWRIDVELEAERRAALRDRARRGHEATARGGPTEVRAIIPGRVVTVSVAPGDALTAGQQILVVEAMKMQNELRAPRDGTVRKVGVAPGENIEVGDLLLVIE